MKLSLSATNIQRPHPIYDNCLMEDGLVRKKKKVTRQKEGPDGAKHQLQGRRRSEGVHPRLAPTS